MTDFNKVQKNIKTMLPQLPHETCSGCSACVSVCPRLALSMQENGEGFLYPVINENICIRCGLCERSCPILHPQKPYDPMEPIAFAAINKDEKIRAESSSGGMFSTFAQPILRQGGVVFGARFADDFTVIHDFTETEEGLAKFRGSKYVQSIIGSAYADCKKFLDEGRFVLFSGTPCQIGGLYAYLRKPYENLYTVDLICHGVPSPLLWKKYVRYREEKAHSKVMKITFREKHNGWKLFSVAFTFSNATEYRKNFEKDPYGRLFIRNIPFRLSCYDCKFKNKKRQSDITLADFWGVEKICPVMFDDRGTSSVFVNSLKGKDLFEKGSMDFTYLELKSDLILQNNSLMMQSARKPEVRTFFFNDLQMDSLVKILKKYTTDSFIIKVYNYIRSHLMTTLYNLSFNKKD